MKQCTNPACNTGYLFSDRYTVCPFCHGPLVSLAGQPAQRAVTETLESPHSHRQEEEDPFLTTEGRKLICHGRVTEVDADSVFQTQKQKFFLALLHGEPYQLSQQNVHTVLCVEEMDAGMAGQVKDFTMYGSIAGKVHVGDEVRICAKDTGGQRVVSNIYNITTDSVVSPRLQIPAFLLRCAIIGIVLFLFALLYGIFDFFNSGAALAWGNAIVNAIILPLSLIGIICYGIYRAIRSVFPKRDRRRGGWL